MQRITKAILLSYCVFALTINVHAQPGCTSRYSDSIYSDITKHSDIAYGQSIQKSGSPQTLVMDIYMATADTSKKRPVIVLAHGGSFMSGDKSEPAIVRLCHAFATRGYVTASINYRLSIATMVGSTGADFTLANYLATQDAKAAVRFFHAKADSLHVDTNLIFGGGTSAGAFTFVQYAYMDKWELPASIDTVLYGGPEGQSGNPGYGSAIRGLINCWGAIGDTSWIHATDVPVVSIHGTSDPVVPYNSGPIFSLPGYLYVYGSQSINTRCMNIGTYSKLKLFIGAGHGVSETSLQMDTVITVISNFLASIINCDSGKAPIRSTANAAVYHESIPWLCMTSPGTIVLYLGTQIQNIRFFTCAGAAVDLHPVIKLSNKSTYLLHPKVPGVYFAVDMKNKKNRSVALRLF